MYNTCRLSASCVHVSALLHALVALRPGTLPGNDEAESDEECQPCTSVSCQWKPPKKRKSMAMQVSTAEFEYERPKKYNIQSLETYDPRLEQFRGKVAERIPKLLDEVKGKGLCVSLLLDQSLRIATPERPILSKEALLLKVEQSETKGKA